MTTAWPGKDGAGVWAWAFVLCAAAVLVLALMPTPPRLASTGWDKSNHLLAFGVLMWLGCKAFAPRAASTAWGLLAYGALIEVLQSFTPNRSAEWYDFLADGLGVALGWAVWRWGDAISAWWQGVCGRWR